MSLSGFDTKILLNSYVEVGILPVFSMLWQNFCLVDIISFSNVWWPLLVGACCEVFLGRKIFHCGLVFLASFLCWLF